jgi:hypothetical protein
LSWRLFPPIVAAWEESAGRRFKDTWTIFLPEFMEQTVLAMIRLQAWTAKPTAPASAV